MPEDDSNHNHYDTDDHGPQARGSGCSHGHEPKLSRSARLVILIEVVAVAVLAGHPLIAESTYNRAASFYALEMPGKAVKHCRKTLALAPNHADAWELIAYCQEMQGRPCEALRSFDMALALDPKLVSAHVESGLLMVRQGKYRAAIPRFRQTAALDPENITAARFAVLCFSALGETEKAIGECEHVLGKFPDDAVTQKWLDKLRKGEMGGPRRDEAAPPADSASSKPLDLSGKGS